MLTEDIKVEINGVSFNVKMIEDSQGPLRIPILDFLNSKVSSCEDSGDQSKEFPEEYVDSGSEEENPSDFFKG